MRAFLLPFLLTVLLGSMQVGSRKLLAHSYCSLHLMDVGGLELSAIVAESADDHLQLRGLSPFMSEATSVLCPPRLHSCLV